MSDALTVGLTLAVVSMLGTVLALGVIAACLPLLQRLLPEPPDSEAVK